MRLLNTKSFELENFSYDAIPRKYAILSHVWGKEEDEIRYSDFQEGRIKEAKRLSIKIEGSCKVARGDGFEYLWIDTICIDNTNSVELQEAINSMFRWYKNATICYAFLSDIPADDRNPWDPKSKFSSSRWFERGWTLQELLAPPRLRFYNCEWHSLGTKGECLRMVEKVTGIPSPYFLGIKTLHDASVAQRMSWAAKRVTKMPEDIAYSLLGIFDIAMPMIYGEGSKKAFTRLQELIMKEIGDDSILAWGFGHEELTSKPLPESLPGRILASSPADFANCGHIQKPEHIATDSFDKFGGSLRLHVPLFTPSLGNKFGLLNCGHSDLVVGIPLMSISSDVSEEYVRPQGIRPMLFPIPEVEVPSTTILVRTEHVKKTLAASSQKYWFSVQGSIETGLELIDVEPRSCWWKEEALIEVDITSQVDTRQLIFVCFRHKAGESSDFLVVLQLKTEDSQSEAEARCHVMVCDRDTSLRIIVGKYSRIRPVILDENRASNGTIHRQAFLDIVQKGSMFLLRMEPLITPPDITYDASVELQILDASTEMSILQDEESTTNVRAASLREAIQEEEKNQKQTEEELALVKVELSRIEAKKAQLIRHNEDAHQNAISHDLRLKATLIYLNHLKERRSSTQHVLSGWINSSDNKSLAESRLPTLNWAVLNGHLSIVQRLLDAGTADVDLKSGILENSPLHVAAYCGDLSIAIILLKHGANIDSRDTLGHTPIFCAVLAESIEVVHLLIRKGASINTKNKNGETPLCEAVGTENENVISLLIEKGADIDAKDMVGQTPLFKAIWTENENVIRLLIGKGADTNTKDLEGQTPLSKAMKTGNENVIRLLLEKGANLFIDRRYAEILSQGAIESLTID